MVDIPIAVRRETGPSRTGARGPTPIEPNLNKFAGDIYDKLLKTRAANEEAEYHGEVNTAMEDWDTFVAANPGAGYDKLNVAREKMMLKIRKAGGKATSPEARNNINNWYSANANLIRAKSQTSMEAIRANQELTAYQVHQKNNMTNFAYDEYEENKDRMIEAGMLHKETADARQVADFGVMREAEHKLIQETAVENTKASLKNILDAGGDKQDALEVLNKATDEFITNDLFTEGEAAQENKEMGDWIDNYVAGRDKKAKDTIKLTTRETYDAFNVAIQDGTLTYDIIAESAMLKADKEKWFDYIKGSYADAPTVSTPAGSNNARDAVFKAATLELSPTEAYDKLLELRYKDKQITDDEFNWGLEKIEKPYKKHILEDLKGTINTNNINRFKLPGFLRSSKSLEKNQKVNDALISWLDDLIEKDAVPQFDLRKKMAAVSAQFRHGMSSLADIGDTITTEDGEWEVTGFYPDGEPFYQRVE